jgi:hypothetical protein
LIQLLTRGLNIDFEILEHDVFLIALDDYLFHNRLLIIGAFVAVGIYPNIVGAFPQFPEQVSAFEISAGPLEDLIAIFSRQIDYDITRVAFCL